MDEEIKIYEIQSDSLFFFNIGQGSCSAYVSPEGKDIYFFDAGSAKNAINPYQNEEEDEQFNSDSLGSGIVRSINAAQDMTAYVVISHPDADHISLLKSILFHTEKKSGSFKTTPSFKEIFFICSSVYPLQKYIEDDFQKHIKFIEISNPQIRPIAENVALCFHNFSFLHGNTDDDSKKNENSLICSLLLTREDKKSIDNINNLINSENKKLEKMQGIFEANVLSDAQEHNNKKQEKKQKTLEKMLQCYKLTNSYKEKKNQFISETNLIKKNIINLYQVFSRNGYCITFTGDATTKTFENSVPVRSNIFVVPHHGADKDHDLSENWEKVFDPEKVVVSAALYSQHEHPRPNRTKFYAEKVKKHKTEMSYLLAQTTKLPTENYFSQSDFYSIGSYHKDNASQTYLYNTTCPYYYTACTSSIFIEKLCTRWIDNGKVFISSRPCVWNKTQSNVYLTQDFFVDFRFQGEHTLQPVNIFWENNIYIMIEHLYQWLCKNKGFISKISITQNRLDLLNIIDQELFSSPLTIQILSCSLNPKENFESAYADILNNMPKELAIVFQYAAPVVFYKEQNFNVFFDKSKDDLTNNLLRRDNKQNKLPNFSRDT
ncbi:hypothetical protein Bealeia2_01964 (plasmid) [Candidatus Bealeia paramacronuclearis]|uniref:hypothetical protein n=1 Tax=Candidatus Bealeia paramacronuclearis TaxID=1921001 RepID=UPI002BBDD089|nr:hypothetical protein [Candidatus Bealeia paramacronuclearis]